MAMSEELKKSLQLLTPKFRVSYPSLHKPSKMEGSDRESYSVEMLFDKSEVKLTDIQKPILAAVREKWGADSKKWPKLKMPYRDGDKPYGKKNEVKPEHAGMWVVRASSSIESGKPATVDIKGREITDPAVIYPGCYARAFVMAFAYSRPEKDGVMLGLDGVQKLSDGESLAGKKSAKEMFGIAGDDGADESSDNELSGLDGADESADDGESFF